MFIDYPQMGYTINGEYYVTLLKVVTKGYQNQSSKKTISFHQDNTPAYKLQWFRWMLCGIVALNFYILLIGHHLTTMHATACEKNSLAWEPLMVTSCRPLISLLTNKIKACTPIGPINCNPDRRIVWTSRGTMLKNIPQLVTSHEGILFGRPMNLSAAPHTRVCVK